MHFLTISECACLASQNSPFDRVILKQKYALKLAKVPLL